MTREDELARYRQTCFSYGFEYGSDAFSKCMLEQERMDREDQRQQEKLRHKQRAMGTSSSRTDYDAITGYHNTRNASHSNRATVQNRTVFNSAPSHDSYSSYRGDTLRDSSIKEMKARTAERDARLRKETARAEQLRKDEALARKLQAEEDRKAEQIRKDEALARKLQAEEDRRAEQIRKDEALARKLQAEEGRRAEQIRKDEALARKLQAEEGRRAEQIKNDEALARKLQAEENAKADIR
ncbi:hypothetical protein ID47_04670 [Candidatus Paracaedibacter acanthamoebae]|uniref:Uncharacterized protein n=2 Tax=Candidatus Odyssella acanthamoebae TaxID=91604 RepID=A0A077AVW2_9PROT|nr:hypothetical protein ID47_04670 [Candidatus Paracaedibacter acanthamoebae]